ncbi:MAG: thioredoxin-dependent thiol peroxidase [Chitinophagaceae bacterium]|nr:MAG: thioredoxin-dependent thiol peroxidase [Chitinophagaceae bacterium]
MLEAGDKVPMFKGIDQNGNVFDYRDHKQKKIIIFFFPKSMTPTCTTQACNLRDNYKELHKRGFTLIGISPDGSELQQKFIKTYKLPYTLISDSDAKIMNRFGVWGEKQLYGRKYEGVHRTTFVIEGRKIMHVFKRPRNKMHSEEIMAVIDNRS